MAAAAKRWRAENEEKLNSQGKESNNQNKDVSLPENRDYGEELAKSNGGQRGGLESSDTSDALSRRT